MIGQLFSIILILTLGRTRELNCWDTGDAGNSPQTPLKVTSRVFRSVYDTSVTTASNIVGIKRATPQEKLRLVNNMSGPST